MDLWYLDDQMEKYIQHQYLKIAHLVASEWQHPVHNHNHFEIIFIHRGKGVHCVSGTYYPYSGQNLFLLAPCDYHRFEIEEETEFTFIKFTNVYPGSIENIPAQSNINRDIDELLIHAGKRERNIEITEEDARKIDQLVGLMRMDWSEKKDELSPFIFHLMQALFVLIKKGVLSGIVPKHSKHDEKLTLLLHYIHQHIYHTDQIQAAHLAEIFGLSKHYLGIFFKEQTGTTLRNYIARYKLNLIENRLKYSSFSIKEISNELGFTDLSHFNKFFKSQTGLNPTSFREKSAQT